MLLSIVNSAAISILCKCLYLCSPLSADICLFLSPLLFTSSFLWVFSALSFPIHTALSHSVFPFENPCLPEQLCPPWDPSFSPQTLTWDLKDNMSLTSCRKQQSADRHSMPCCPTLRRSLDSRCTPPTLRR